MSERPEEEDRVVYTGGVGGRVPRFSGAPAAGPGLDIGHSPRFAGGEAPPLPPRRPSSGSAHGGLSASVSAAVAAVADAAGSGPVGGVRGSSAGRGRELAPNPRVDLRAYLADEQAEAAAAQAEAVAAAAAMAEQEDVPGDRYTPEGDGDAYPEHEGVDVEAQGQEGQEQAADPYLHGDEAAEADAAVNAAAAAVAEAMQSIPVPADDLAAKLAAVAAEREEAVEGEEAAHAVGENGMEELVPEQAAEAEAQSYEQRHADANGEDALRALHGSVPVRANGRYGAAADADQYGEGGEEGEAAVGDQDGCMVGDDEEGGGGAEGYSEAVVEDDGAGEGEEDVALSSLPFERVGSLGTRRTPSGHLRPTSARPTSARPSAASPARGSSGRMQRQGSGVGAASDGFDGGMGVIHEQSETAADMDA